MKTVANLENARARGMEAIGAERVNSAALDPNVGLASRDPVCESRSQAEQLVSEIADAARARDLLAARMGQITARVRTKFQPQMERCEKEIKAKTEAVEKWATENRSEEFVVGKSIETTHGVVGFRKSGWSLGLLGKETWGSVTARIRKSKVWRKLYLRVIYEPDRRQILTDLAKEKLTPVEARKIGVERWQEESFFLNIK